MLLVSKELSPGSLLTDLASPSTELTCTQISVLIVFEETCLIKEFPQVENHMWLYASFSKSLFIVKEWSCCVRREGRVPGKKREPCCMAFQLSPNQHGTVWVLTSWSWILSPCLSGRWRAVIPFYLTGRCLGSNEFVYVKVSKTSCAVQILGLV